MTMAITLTLTISNHITLTETKNMADERDDTIPDQQSAVTTQYSGSGPIRVMPSAIMSRAASPTQTIKVKSFELKDDQRWAFDLQLVQQTKGAANPSDVNGVLGDYIAKLVARHCEVDGMDDAEWLTFFRATYRPAAGKVFTINIRETLKPLIPKALPVNIFVQDPADPDSKFKLTFKGETAIVKFNRETPDCCWMHIFIPITVLASEPELQAATGAMLEKIGLALKPEKHDFNLTEAEKGKYHVNFKVGTDRDIVAENMYRLSKFTIRDIGIHTYVSRQFMALMPENCPKCYVWMRHNACMCSGKGKGQAKTDHKRYKDQEAAAKRKRRAEAATSDASF